MDSFLFNSFLFHTKRFTLRLVAAYVILPQSGIRELKSFAQGIRHDYAAVKAAFSSKWSNGQTEAQVNCLKLQKRLMFGRANFDLLRLHVLRRA